MRQTCLVSRSLAWLMESPPAPGRRTFPAGGWRLARHEAPGRPCRPREMCFPRPATSAPAASAVPARPKPPSRSRPPGQMPRRRPYCARLRQAGAAALSFFSCPRFFSVRCPISRVHCFLLAAQRARQHSAGHTGNRAAGKLGKRFNGAAGRRAAWRWQLSSQRARQIWGMPPNLTQGEVEAALHSERHACKICVTSSDSVIYPFSS